MDNKILLVFFGPPASGKGTQTHLLEKRTKLPVISPGELLRREMKLKSDVGIMAAEMVSKGELVPDETIFDLIDKRLDEDDVVKGFILDGFPRRQSQLDFLVRVLETKFTSDDRVMAVYIDVTDEVIRNRISLRRVCECGETYHLESNPPAEEGTCDKCGGTLVQRRDDKPEVVNERIKGFHKRIGPLVKYFKKNHEYVEINGEKSIAEIEELIEKEVVKKLGLE